MKDAVLAGLARVETKVNAVKDDTSAIRPLVEDIHRRPATIANNEADPPHTSSASVSANATLRLSAQTPTTSLPTGGGSTPAAALPAARIKNPSASSTNLRATPSTTGNPRLPERQLEHISVAVTAVQTLETV